MFGFFGNKTTKHTTHLNKCLIGNDKSMQAHFLSSLRKKSNLDAVITPTLRYARHQKKHVNVLAIGVQTSKKLACANHTFLSVKAKNNDNEDRLFLRIFFLFGAKKKSLNFFFSSNHLLKVTSNQRLEKKERILGKKFRCILNIE